MTNLIPLLNHLAVVNATPLEELDMIGSAVRYTDLSPNWRKELDSLPFYNHDFEEESTWSYALQSTEGKPVGIAPHDRGKYDWDNKIDLVKAVLWNALSRNRKLNPYTFWWKGFSDNMPKGEAYHPLHILIAMQQRESIGVSLAVRWIDDEEEDRCFPTHKIILKG